MTTKEEIIPISLEELLRMNFRVQIDTEVSRKAAARHPHATLCAAYEGELKNKHGKRLEIVVIEEGRIFIYLDNKLESLWPYSDNDVVNLMGLIGLIAR